MRHLLSQTFTHLLYRLISAFCTFVFFSLISEKASHNDIDRSFYFLFTLGFGISAFRLISQLNWAIDGRETPHARLRCTYSGLKAVTKILPILLVVFTAIIWMHTESAPVTLAAAFIAALAPYDIDSARAITGRTQLFSGATAIGSITSLTLILLIKSPNFNTVCALCMVQWAPVSLLNLTYLIRIKTKLLKLGHSKPIQTSISTLPLALLDGIALNMPFIAAINLPPSDAITLSLGVRIFVASIPILPLLLHWSNSESINTLSEKSGTSPQKTFFLLLSLSGTAIGVIFSTIYFYINKTIDLSAITVFICILTSYSFYISSTRFKSIYLPTKTKTKITATSYALLVLMYAGVPTIAAHTLETIIIAQTIPLALCALMTNILPKPKQ